MPTAATIPQKVAAALTAPPKKLVSIGPTIDKLCELRDAKRALDAKVAEIETEYKTLEEQLMEKLDAEGTTAGKGTKASASITSGVVGNVTDWAAFEAFVIKKKFTHLFQRRLSDPAIRELFEKGMKVPGVEPFTKRRLNLRSGV